jgi:hypothetical protein
MEEAGSHGAGVGRSLMDEDVYESPDAGLASSFSSSQISSYRDLLRKYHRHYSSVTDYTSWE